MSDNRQGKGLKLVLSLVGGMFAFLVLVLPASGQLLKTNLFEQFDALQLFSTESQSVQYAGTAESKCDEIKMDIMELEMMYEKYYRQAEEDEKNGIESKHMEYAKEAYNKMEHYQVEYQECQDQEQREIEKRQQEELEIKMKMEEEERLKKLQEQEELEIKMKMEEEERLKKLQEQEELEKKLKAEEEFKKKLEDEARLKAEQEELELKIKQEKEELEKKLKAEEERLKKLEEQRDPQAEIGPDVVSECKREVDEISALDKEIAEYKRLGAEEKADYLKKEVTSKKEAFAAKCLDAPKDDDERRSTNEDEVIVQVVDYQSCDHLEKDIMKYDDKLKKIEAAGNKNQFRSVSAEAAELKDIFRKKCASNDRGVTVDDHEVTVNDHEVTVDDHEMATDEYEVIWQIVDQALAELPELKEYVTVDLYEAGLIYQEDADILYEIIDDMYFALGEMEYAAEDGLGVQTILERHYYWNEDANLLTLENLHEEFLWYEKCFITGGCGDDSYFDEDAYDSGPYDYGFDGSVAVEESSVVMFERDSVQVDRQKLSIGTDDIAVKVEAKKRIELKDKVKLKKLVVGMDERVKTKVLLESNEKTLETLERLQDVCTVDARQLRTLLKNVDENHLDNAFARKAKLIDAYSQVKPRLAEVKSGKQILQEIDRKVCNYNFSDDATDAFVKKLYELEGRVDLAKNNPKKVTANTLRDLNVAVIDNQLIPRSQMDKFKSGETACADVDDNAWYSEEFVEAKKEGYVKGDSKTGECKPNEKIVKAELSTFIARAYDLKLVSDESDQWYDPAMRAGKRINAIMGEASEGATRGDVAHAIFYTMKHDDVQVLRRMVAEMKLKMQDKGSFRFKDMPENHPHFVSSHFAAYYGIIDQNPLGMRVDEKITKAEVVTMIRRAKKLWDQETRVMDR